MTLSSTSAVDGESLRAREAALRRLGERWFDAALVSGLAAPTQDGGIPPETAPPFTLGLHAAAAGRWRAALPHLQQAHALDREDQDAAAALAHALLALGRWREAFEALERASGDGATLRDAVALVTEQARERIEALIARRNAEAAPLERAFALELAGLLVAQGRPAMAAPICERLLQEDRSDFDALLLQVEAVAQSRGPAAALALLETAGATISDELAHGVAMARFHFECGALIQALAHGGPVRHADRALYARILRAARREAELLAFCNAWMAEEPEAAEVARALLPRDTPRPSDAAPPPSPAFSVEALIGRWYRYGRVDGSLVAHLQLGPNGTIIGYHHPTETGWAIAGDTLIFRDSDGNISTIFRLRERTEGLHRFVGEFVPRGPGDWHVLEELAARPRLRRIHEELCDELYGGESPLAYSQSRFEDDGYPHTHLIADIAESVLDVVRPHFWLELGSMLGGSAIRIADIAKQKGCDLDIVCVDPFTGDVNMWTWEQPKKRQGHWQFLRLEQGRPTIYDRFLANVTAAGHADIILPIAATSIVGIKVIQRLFDEHRVTSLPRVIYLDSAHEPDETFLELQQCWALLEPGGVLLGDDWAWPAVRDDVIRFARTVTVNRERNRELIARHGAFVEEDGILLDRGQWLLTK